MSLLTIPPAYLECTECGAKIITESYLPTKNPFIAYGRVPVCNSCLKKMIEAKLKPRQDLNWTYINKLCQWIDIPFLADKWIKTYEECGSNAADAFIVYVKVFSAAPYNDRLEWLRYNEKYVELKSRGLLESTIDVFSEAKRADLVSKWGESFDDQDLNELETLYEAIKNTQNIANPIQQSEARKLCMISLRIDKLIRNGEAFDKDLAGYDKLKTSAGFTAANTKNASDFESTGEVFAFLEKIGWVNSYAHDIRQDIVDETIANMQTHVQRLYVNEGGMGEAITDRATILQNVSDKEVVYDLVTPDLDEYEKEMLSQIVAAESTDGEANLEEEL